MKNLIYYPGFEIQSQSFLKFSLIYMDKLLPIIPYSAERTLSDSFYKIQYETDLLEIYHPEYDIAEIATQETIRNVKFILGHPSLYQRRFLHKNFIETWKQPSEQNFQLFEEKYAYEWEFFCIENHFGRRTPEGLLIPYQLGVLYMSLFAHIIADTKNFEAITDHSDLGNNSIFWRNVNRKQDEKINMVKNTIFLNLPENIANIPLDKFIKFRNQNDFHDKINNFNKELDNYLNLAESHSISARDFTESLSRNKILSEFRNELLVFGLSLIPIALNVWLASNYSSSPNVELAKEVATLGTLAGISIVDAGNIYNKTEPKRIARKYLASVRNISHI